MATSGIFSFSEELAEAIWVPSFFDSLIQAAGEESSGGITSESISNSGKKCSERKCTDIYLPIFKEKHHPAGTIGLIFVSGNSWKQHRRFGVMTMQRLGLGKKTLETRIKDEAHNLVVFCNGKRKAFDPSDSVIHSVSNVIVYGLFGHLFARDDKVFKKVAEANDFVAHFLGSAWGRGTIIIPNLSSSMLDRDYWETPNQFNPGNFLEKEGNLVTNEAFLPFSAGLRACVGEHMARVELFIFFTSLLRAFTFRSQHELHDGFYLATTPIYDLCHSPLA